VTASQKRAAADIGASLHRGASIKAAGRRAGRAGDDLPHPHEKPVAADDADRNDPSDPERQHEKGQKFPLRTFVTASLAPLSWFMIRLMGLGHAFARYGWNNLA
jgi:hypothetical protein